MKLEHDDRDLCLKTFEMWCTTRAKLASTKSHVIRVGRASCV